MLQRDEDREFIPRAERSDLKAVPGPVILQDSRQQLAGPFKAWLLEEEYPEPVRKDIHQAFEIGVLLEGEQDRYFEDLVLKLHPGDLYLSPAWECHGWQTVAPKTRTLVTHFLPEFLGEESFEGTSWLNLFAVPARERPRAASAAARRQVLSIAAELAEGARAKQRGWLAGSRLNVLKLLWIVWREWRPGMRQGSHHVADAGDLGQLSPAISLVRQRPAARTSLAEAAKACSLGRTQFSLLFRKTMGLSFGRFVSRFRALKAAEVLVSTGLPLGDIAEELGFTDAAHLHRAFTKEYGCTPGQYRRGIHTAEVMPKR